MTDPPHPGNEQACSPTSEHRFIKTANSLFRSVIILLTALLKISGDVAEDFYSGMQHHGVIGNNEIRGQSRLGSRLNRATDTGKIP